MFKLISFFTLLLLLSGCVSKKKFLEQQLSLEQQLFIEKNTSAQQIDSLQIALLKAQGGNELLLVAQKQFQERLIELDNARRQLSGNLSATSTKLEQRVKQLTEEKTELIKSAASLKQAYLNTIDDFTEELSSMANTLKQDSIIDSLVTIRVKSGSLSLSVQEELFFSGQAYDRLLPEGNQILQTIVDVLHAYPLLELQVIGHTDNAKPPRGQPDNRTFAGLRAATITTELTNNYYLSASRITAASQGDSTPLKSNETAEGRKANRRIEFRINNSLPNLLRELEAIGKEKE